MERLIGRDVGDAFDENSPQEGEGTFFGIKGRWVKGGTASRAHYRFYAPRPGVVVPTEGMSYRDIAELPVLIQEDGIATCRHPSGDICFRVPERSDNGRGWWAGDTRVYRLFWDLGEAEKYLFAK